MEKITAFFKSLSPTTWIIIAIVILLIIALIIYFNSKPDKKDISANNNIATNENNSQPRSVFPLQYGSRGDEVKVFQSYLNSYLVVGSTDVPLVIDGIWGPKTDAASLKFWKKGTVSKEEYDTKINIAKPIKA